MIVQSCGDSLLTRDDIQHSVAAGNEEMAANVSRKIEFLLPVFIHFPIHIHCLLLI